ncbi:hypothetical protein QUB47_22735 [Microcoleus sp. AT9_B5]
MTDSLYNYQNKRAQAQLRPRIFLRTAIDAEEPLFYLLDRGKFDRFL